MLRYNWRDFQHFTFDYLTNSTIGHSGRHGMDFKLKSKYYNITNETIMVYLNLCIN